MSLSRRVLFRLVAADALAPAFRTIGRGLVSILTLHRFADPRHGVVGHDPAALRGHLAYLRRHRYRLLGLTDVLTLLEHGDGRAAQPAVAFTIDDGYAEFAHLAAPIFAEYDCPVTAFVPTGFLDGRLWLWWDRASHVFTHTRRPSLVLRLGRETRAYRWGTPDELARARSDVLICLELVDAPEREAAIASLAEQLDVEVPARPPPAFAPMTWDDVRRAAKLGATFGPHTVTHRILSQAPAEACDWEIRESYRRLREQTDACVPVFCYPAGGAGPRELEAVQRAGLRAAVTTVPTYTVPHQLRNGDGLDRFAIPRFPCPYDLPHLVDTVSGLARYRRRLPPPRRRA